eukprot:Pgem_evm1s3077
MINGLLGISTRLSDNGEVILWDREVETPLDSVLNDWLSYPNIVAVNIMHTKIPAILPTLKIVRKFYAGHIGCYPDHGKFSMPSWKFEPLSANDLVKACATFVSEAKVSMLGGCCGISTDSIEAISLYRLGYNNNVDIVHSILHQQKKNDDIFQTHTTIPKSKKKAKNKHVPSFAIDVNDIEETSPTKLQTEKTKKSSNFF